MASSSALAGLRQQHAEVARLAAHPRTAAIRAGIRAHDRWESRWVRGLLAVYRGTTPDAVELRDRVLSAALRAVAKDGDGPKLPPDDEAALRAQAEEVSRTELAARRARMAAVMAELTDSLHGHVATRDFHRGAMAVYLGLGPDEGEDAGQHALDALGLNRTFRWAGQRDFVANQLAIRGSKVIQAAHGEHRRALGALVARATDPAHPRTIDQLTNDILASWDGLARWQARRIARTESALVWERTNWYVMVANGVAEYDWLVAHGPAIGHGVGPVCDACLAKAAGSPYPINAGPLPPEDSHPNCRCTAVPHIGPGWLPPAEPFTGWQQVPDVLTETRDGVPVRKARQRVEAGWLAPAAPHPSGWGRALPPDETTTAPTVPLPEWLTTLTPTEARDLIEQAELLRAEG